MTTRGQETDLLCHLAPARVAPYLAAVDGDSLRAEALYQWNASLTGAWHVHLGYVEVSARQAMDRQLQAWNQTQRSRSGAPFPAAWTGVHAAAPLLYELIGQGIDKAREAAATQVGLRPRGHPRRNCHVTHDDVVAQLMFGAWSRLLLLPGQRGPRAGQRRLWDECLSLAFPNARDGAQGLEWVGRQVDGLRRLRNRVAHHESLLEVDTQARLNGSLALLRMVDSRLPEAVMRSSQLRTIERQDPRRLWRGRS